MSAMNMISTKLKEKIPKGFSYPIGAEKLSAGLSRAPQLSMFELQFRYRDEFWASSYNVKLKEKRPQKIIEVTYRNPSIGISSSQHLIDAGYYAPSWMIKVYAVPKDYLADVKEQLDHAVIHSLEEWLVKVGVTDSRDSMVKCYVYDPHSRKLTERT